MGRGTRGQARGILLAHGVEDAEAVLGTVQFHFQVVGDCLAFMPVAKHHLVAGVFELEALQHMLECRGFFGMETLSCDLGGLTEVFFSV